MSAPKAIIIGAGLGGLECGCILGRCGYDVTVLEQDFETGGCLQTFRRKGLVFDTGFHYVGGLGEGEVLHPLARYFNLLDLPWLKMDEDCVDEIHIGGSSYRLASGYRRFVDTLAADFPSCRGGLETYVATLEKIGRMALGSFGSGDSMKYFGTSAYGFLCDTIPDERLRQILGGASMRLDQDAETLPLYVYAQINNSFIQSGWRLHGGGSLIAERLGSEIQSHGGEVITGAEVKSIEVADGTAKAVLTSDGRRYEGDLFISNAHPTATLELLDETSGIRKAYRRRIESLPDSYGIFTVNVELEDGRIPYINHNVYVHVEGTDPWHPDPGKPGSFLASSVIPENGGRWARNIDIMTPMSYSGVSRWEGTSPMKRGNEYENLKDSLREKCFKAISTAIPGFTDAVKSSYTSTALTWRDYTSTRSGSAFGIRKDWRNPLTTVLSPSTPVRNLFLTGQSLNLHGVLGVTMTSLYTCAAILGTEKIKKELNI